MPAVPAPLTVAQARDQVLIRLGIGADGQASPELVAQVEATVGTVQRTLALDNDWMLPRRRRALTGWAGRFWYPLPCERAGLIRLTWQQGSGMPMVLNPAAVVEDYLWKLGTPEAFAIERTTGVVGVTVGAGGAGYTNGAPATFSEPGGTGSVAAGTVAATAGAITGVTLDDWGADYAAPPSVGVMGGTGAVLTAVLGEVDAILFPVAPAAPGTAYIEWKDTPAAILAAGDPLSLDAEAVILATAAMIAPAVASGMAGRLAEQVPAYLERLRTAKPSGGGVSMSTWRRR